MTATRTALLAYAAALETVVDLSRTLIDSQPTAPIQEPDVDLGRLDKCMEVNEELRRKLQALHVHKADAGRRIAALEESIGARNRQIESMFDTAEEKSALIKKLEAKVADLEGATTTPAAGDDTLDALKKEKTKLTSRVQAAELELENARADLKQAQIDLAQAGEMHGKITAERDTLTEKVTELEEKLAAAHAPGKDQDQKIRALDAEAIRLRGLNNDKTKELREARAQRKKLEAILTEKTTALDEAVADRDAAVGEARDLRDQGAVAPDQEIKLARAALGRAVRLLTNDADDYAFEPEDRVVLLLSEALTRLDGKAKA